MKILLINYRYFISGGPERYMFNVKIALEEKGHKVIPFSIKNSQNEESEYSDYFVQNIGNSDEIFIDKYPRKVKTYVDLIGREFYSFYVRNKLEKLINKEKPDICYLLVYKRALSPSVIDACKKYRIPVINRISDYNTVCGAGSLYRKGNYCDCCIKNDIYCLKNNCIKNNKIYSLSRYLSIKLHKALKVDKKIDAYICTNLYMAERMIEYGYDKNKINIIPTFFKESKEIQNLNKENKIISQKINFLFIGNVDESKGIYDLLKAISLLRKKTENFHLFIVGGIHIEENSEIKNIIDTDKLQKFITLIPFIRNTKVFEYYIKSNVTIIPTRWVENLPNTLIESIYFHRPVIVPNFGSFKFTTNNDVSFKYKPLSVLSLYNCLLKICKNPYLIIEKSNKCEKFFMDNYSEDIHIKKILKLFKEKINENN